MSSFPLLLCKNTNPDFESIHNYWLQVASMDTQLKAFIAKSKGIEYWQVSSHKTVIEIRKP